jgi:uncharacterized protein YneF (UPF0154 family)
MIQASFQRSGRHGITVLGLLLLIIALMVGGFFLVRYLRTRQAATQSPPLLSPSTLVFTA